MDINEVALLLKDTYKAPGTPARTEGRGGKAPIEGTL